MSNEQRNGKSGQSLATNISNEHLEKNENTTINSLTERVAAFELESELNSRNSQYNDIASTLYDDDTASTLYSDNASTLYDDNASTLYDDNASTLYDDTASTLFDDSTSTLNNDRDDTSTLVGVKKVNPTAQFLTENDLTYLKAVVTGVELKYSDVDKEIVMYCVVSIRQAIRKSREDEIHDRYRELWRIEKSFNDFNSFDIILKQHGLPKIGRLPDKKVFNSHTPTNADQRKMLIDVYFRILFSLLPIKDASPICQFFNSNIASSRKKHFGRTTKEGYLTRKEGQFFGGTYKIRYWVVKGTSFQSYETSAGGSPVSSIPLDSAIIGKLQEPLGTSPDKQHAVVVLQLRKDKGNLDDKNRQVLYAPSKSECLIWEQALCDAMHLIDKQRKEGKKDKYFSDSLLGKMSQKKPLTTKKVI